MKAEGIVCAREGDFTDNFIRSVKNLESLFKHSQNLTQSHNHFSTTSKCLTFTTYQNYVCFCENVK